MMLTILLTLVLVAATAAQAAPRSSAEVCEFRRQHACSATASTRGPCVGFNIDHVRPLCAGGPDAVANMQWLTVEAHRAKTRIDLQQCAVLRKAGV